MKKWSHLVFNSIILIPLGVFIYVYILQSTVIAVFIYFGIAFGALAPDIDAGSEIHRYWLCHSIIVPSIAWILALAYPIVMFLVALFALSVGLHLLADMHLSERFMTGFYCIKTAIYLPVVKKWVMKRSFSGKKSTWWLFLNFVASIVLLLITIFLVI